MSSPFPIRTTARRGLSSLEVIVSLTLLASAIACSLPLLVAHGRLLKTQRNYRLAVDELASQLDVLGTLPASELPSAMEKLAPSTSLAERLPGATLRGELADSQLGRRLTLELVWNEPNRQAAPVRLTSWLVPSANAPSEELAP
jgi:hypothetical protein